MPALRVQIPKVLDHTANDVNRPLPGAGVPEVVAKTTAAWTPDLEDVASLVRQISANHPGVRVIPVHLFAREREFT